MSPLPQALPRERILAMLRERPAQTAVLCDIDGTLAPVVDRADDATVPAATREVLNALGDRFALVACISGRRAEGAGRLVGFTSLTYIATHGPERPALGAPRPEIDPGLAPPARRVRAFATGRFDDRLRAAGV